MFGLNHVWKACFRFASSLNSLADTADEINAQVRAQMTYIPTTDAEARLLGYGSSPEIEASAMQPEPAITAPTRRRKTVAE